MADEPEEPKDVVARIDEQDVKERTLEISAAFASAVPWVGGAISNYLTGHANDRKFHRVADELKALAKDLARVESEAAKRFVRTDEFEDLLDLTMRKLADERDERKRKMYRTFLVNTVGAPEEPWNEKTKYLRTIDDVEPDHVTLLGALLKEPDRNLPPMSFGSVSSTIRKRAPVVAGRLNELSRDLDRLGLAHIGETGGMMTGHGAEDLRGRVTPYGQRFARYLLQD